MTPRIRCPICEKPMDQGPSEWPDWPFCSRRCKTIDLGRWLGGVYRIEAPVPAEDPELENPHPPAAGASDLD